MAAFFLWCILFILCWPLALMALVFGFIGLMVAVPLLAAVMVPIKMLYVEDALGDEIGVEDDGDDGPLRDG